MQGRAVLLVDDEPAYGVIVRALAEPFGIGVDLVPDTLEALRAARSTQYSLVLMDIEMAGMTGLRGTAVLRQTSEWARRVPVIAFTAFRPPTGERFFLERDFDGWLPKPFDANDLFAVFARWLGEPLPAQAAADRSRQLDTLLGRDQLRQMVERLEAGLADAIRAIDAGADRKDLAHKLGGLMGTVGFTELGAAWLALGDSRTDIWRTVRKLSLEWLDRRKQAAPSADSTRG